ncbi:MAG: GntR family transcriptional regulator [Defluviitaleaceae bacterium]|nr:GntR family transcriptional regulator [Defluviitaleaceae bacterium]
MGITEDNKKPAHTKKTVLYRMIYEDIKEKILNQTYKDNERLPFERELCETYSVDRVTVRKSLDLLVTDGLIEKRPGLGSFVKSFASNGSSNKQESRNILFVMSNNTNDVKSNPSAFNSQLFHAIEQECRFNGYSLFYAVVDDQTSLASLTNGNVFAGILFVSYIPQQFLEQCVQMKLPIICINSRFSNVISIVPEDERGAYDAVKYLNSQGHKKIGILLGKRDYYSTNERLRGYTVAMSEAGINMNPSYIMEGDWTFESAREAIFKLLDTVPEEELPTAIFCCSDMMAIGAIDALKERDIPLPKQISIVGFDNISHSERVFPRLTTIAVNIKLMAELAVEKVTAYSSESQGRGYLIQIPTSLVVRQSVNNIN